MLSNFGPSQGRRGLENGSIWDHKWLKNGSQPWFSKNDPSPVVVPKRMTIAHFEPLLSCSHPLSSAYLVCHLSLLMFLPPPAQSHYSILVRGRGRGRCRVRPRLRVGVGDRVRVGFKDSVGVQSGQNFPLGGLGAHRASGAHELLRVALWQLTVGRRPPRGGGGVVGILGPSDPPPSGKDHLKHQTPTSNLKA